MVEINVRRKNWLIPFFRQVKEQFEPSSFAGADFESWLATTLRQRGFLTGAQRRLPQSNEETDRNIALFLNTLGHQMEMLLELRALCQLDTRTVGEELSVLLVVALLDFLVSVVG